jgi:hypothetical protein
MPPDVQLWHIYFVANCRHTSPHPMDKLVVVVHIDGNAWGCLINSVVREWIRKRSDLLVCEAAILENEHACLTHDSFVDCRTLHEFSASELTADRGEISPQAKQAVLNAIRDCRTIETKYKKAILAREGIL